MIDVYVELENIIWESNNAEASQGSECTFTIPFLESGAFRIAVQQYLIEKTGYRPKSWDYRRLIIVRERY